MNICNHHLVGLIISFLIVITTIITIIKEKKGDAPDDPEYVKERDAFFKSNAPENAPYNGWWRCQGYKEKETNKMFKRKESNK